ncbi:RNase adapter RapZ [Segniliparus rugosus]|uniref:Uncharacterized protein n=1 Tax=Segniliparus rugosus (strain ATCC BAA-974 / DSM 45345 / CCUG 50838 / CIP 108380 / JCM 13579 / CDC 945) TaxID=679197 RepID=E5XLB8_SEGRC|nr:RNase adapter RapZ [Segniliparus rugosus]EFV14837.1 hypothetical protein HMPREF9336_00287 [Segniliparus rugosus ATCC BAA-974]
MTEPEKKLESPAIEVLFLTGLSGAGLGTAAKILEDVGWYVADNLPPQLVTRMVEIGLDPQTQIPRLAVVVDSRTRDFTGDIHSLLAELRGQGLDPKVLFLQASDEVLIRRFEQVRRRHPLQGQDTLAEGIKRERNLLEPLLAEADSILDTSVSSVKELRDMVEQEWGGSAARAKTSVTVQSFGFKYGLPLDANMVADVRFLPNPHWVRHLRDHTGLDHEVSEYVLGAPGAREYLRTYHELLRLMLTSYRKEAKRYMTIAVGCTGGKHRSVAMAVALGALIGQDDQLTVRVIHRDLGLE